MAKPKLYFPKFMLEQRRWMVRPHDEAKIKLPEAAYDEPPPGYDEPGVSFKRNWDNPTTWATFDDAVDYWVANVDTYAGLCYVLHPVGDTGVKLRLVCFDFDGNTIDKDGNVDPDVMAFIEETSSFVEISQSGRGLHVFVFMMIEPIGAVYQYPFNDRVKVDVLCPSQIAVTGEVFQDYTALNVVPAEIADRFPSKRRERCDEDLPDFWNEDNLGIRKDHGYLVKHMEEWPPCIEGHGGDKEMYRAACFLARHGATGWDAFNLLEIVEQVPDFDEYELQHKIDSAWLSAHAEGEFGVDGLDCFDEFPLDPPLPPEEELEKLRERFGIRTAEQIQAVADPVFLVENLFVDKESLFVGGREKSFKTGLAVDLAISLASGRDFLGMFPIQSTRRVIVFTAEIGEPGIKLLINRICRHKGIDPLIDNLTVSSSLPNFQINKGGTVVDPVGRLDLKRLFELDGTEVAVFDPLYFALLGTAIGDMNAIGGVLRNISTLCSDCNVWPIICHHARKDATREYQPMTLGDLSGSGVPAFARQWLLSSHAEEMVDGKASLFVRTGGSTPGDRGLWRVNINEGNSDELTDRKWNVTVSTEADHDTYASQRDAIIDALRYYGRLETIGSIALYADVETSVAKRILVELVKEDVAYLESCKFSINSD